MVRLTRGIARAEENDMQRYFFDLMGERPHYDFSGHDLPSVTRAYELAELMALDLSIEPDERWGGWSIDVRNTLGQKLCTVPVAAENAAAA
jgi:hypothetical protein